VREPPRPTPIEMRLRRLPAAPPPARDHVPALAVVFGMVCFAGVVAAVAGVLLAIESLPLLLLAILLSVRAS
jgi:hypothetical protein